MIKGNNIGVNDIDALTPNICMGLRQDAVFYKDDSTNHPVNAYRGRTWAHGYAICTAFQTILPPNSPSCYDTVAPGGTAAGIFSATSEHSGGVNTLFVDGSVAFISETIDTGSLGSTTPMRMGESPYGLWGALGTIAGGETRSL